MRYSRAMVRLLGGLVLLSACAPSYARVRYVPDDYYARRIDLYDYSPDYYGDWRYYYRDWSPVVVYEYDGFYYPRRFRGTRAVEVYRDRSGYFLPPRDRDWSRADRRFDSRRRPTHSDYARARRHDGRPRH